MSSSPNLQLPFIMPAQAQKHVTHNEALQVLDTVVQMAVQRADLAAPPAGPQEGDRYLVAAGATGAWAGKDAEIAVWQDGAWAFLAPREGWTVWDAAGGAPLVHAQGAWRTLTPQVMDMLGIATSPDATNRLAVASPATLLTHDGAGHQLKLNRATATNTASIVFQTGFTGGAEIGLAGGNDLAFKTSTDGTAWVDALTVSPEGRVGLSQPAPSAALHLDMPSTRSGDPCILITGTAQNGSNDSAGVGIYLSHNGTNNRQFTILDSVTRRGVRIYGNTIDGFENGARSDLKLGSHTTAVNVGIPVANAQFSASNRSGDPARSVAELKGASGQTAPYLRISTEAGVGDILVVDGNGHLGVATAAPTAPLHVEGAMRAATVAAAALPDATALGAGAFLFMTETSGAVAPVFSDGSVWRRFSDGTVAP